MIGVNKNLFYFRNCYIINYLIIFKTNQMVFAEIFGTLGMVSAFVLGLSPIPGIYEGYKNMDIKNITYSYLICAICNCSLWLLYGIKGDDFFLFLTNGFLLILFLIYFSIFLFIKKEEIFRIGIYIFGVIISMIMIYTLLSMNFIGNLALFFNSVWSLTALENLKVCLKYKDPKLINIQISLVTTFCSLCWLLYGISINHICIMVPNFIGFILWAANLIAYYWSIEKITDQNIVIVYLKKIVLFNENDSNYSKMDSLHEDYENNNNNFSDFKTSGKSNNPKINL